MASPMAPEANDPHTTLVHRAHGAVGKTCIYSTFARDRIAYFRGARRKARCQRLLLY